MKILGRKLTSIALILSFMFSFTVTVKAGCEPVEGLYFWPTNVEVEGKIDDSTAKSGKYSYKLVNKTPQGAMKYFNLGIQYNYGEAGKTYLIGLDLKAEGASTLSMNTGSDKISLNSFGHTFDWKHFEIEYTAEKDGKILVQIMIEDDGTVWYDNVFLKDKETGENFIVNGDFEPKGAEAEPEGEEADESEENKVIVINPEEAGYGSFANYDDYIAKRNELKAKPSFTVADMEKFNNIGSRPLYRAEDITLDGSGEGWDKYPPFVMTLDRVNYVDYMNVGNDINGEVRVAQDDEYFYIHALINDDKFCPLPGTDGYWKGDGVQFTFSQDNVFGIEIGAAWNPDQGIPMAYSSFISGEKLDNVKVAIKQNEGNQVYDIAVPWTSVFDEGKPERFQFNICFNDNDDGTNRHDCMEIEPGILIIKEAKGNPVLVPVDDDNAFLAWTEAETSGNQNTEIGGVAYLVNLSDNEKVFKITNYAWDIDTEVVVPAKTGVRYDYSHIYDTAGIYSYDISIEADGKIITDTYSVTLSFNEGTPEEADVLLADVKKWCDEINALYEQVQKKGIDAPYEYSRVYTLNLFPDRIKQDIDLKLYYRIGYWRDTLTTLYNETKALLLEIINGEREPIQVPVYQTSDYTLDGTVMYADTTFNGVTENRPVFFWGYLPHFPLVDNAIEDMPDLGANCAVFEYTMDTAIRDGSSVNFWTNTWSNGNFKGTLGRSYEEAYEGESSYKITMDVDMQPNTYRHCRKVLYVKPSTTYTLSFYAKGVDVNSAKWGINGFTTGISGNYDWKLCETKFTTGPAETEKHFELMVDGRTTGLYLDNMSLVEEGSNKNEFATADWDFEFAPELKEQYDKNGYFVYQGPLDVSRLEKCEEDNVSVGLLLSVAHNLPAFVHDKMPETWLRSNGFNTVSFGNDKYRELVEAYLRYMMENIKDFTCVNYIDIANEVQMNSWSNTSYYLPRFQKWLQDKYGTIENMNAQIGTKYKSFNAVMWPSGANAEEPLTYEYDLYNDWELSDFHRFCANIIHEYVPDMPVWSKIMDYTHDYGDVHHYAYYTNGTGLDAHADVFNVNGCDAYNYLDWNRGRLIKEQWYDYMVGTNYAPVFNGEDHVIKDSSGNYSPDQALWVANDLWQGAIHYRGQTDLWLWDSREAEVITKGSVKARPDVIVKTSEAGLDMNRLSWEIAALQKEQRDVGILYSEFSGTMNTSYPGCQYYAYEATLFSGQKVNYISESVIERIHDTKVLLLAQTSHVNPKTLAEIKKYIENGGEVVIIGKNSLKKDWYHRASDMNIVNFIYDNARIVDAEADRFKKGLTTGSVEEIYRAVNDAIEDAGIQHVKLVDAETGKEVYNVEYTSTIYDGKLLINVCNWGEEDKILKVMVDGEEVTGFTELRSLKAVEGDIVANYIEPILLSVDWDRTKFLDVIGHWSEDAVTSLTNDGLVSGISDTRYAPDKALTRAEFLALITRATGLKGQYRNQIADVSVDAWYADTVAAGLDAGLIGRENFRPNEVVTRDEMAEIMIKALEGRIGTVESGDNNFKDAGTIKNIDAVSKAAGLGILSGYEDGNFRPTSGLTRGEAASMLIRFIEKLN